MFSFAKCSYYTFDCPSRLASSMKFSIPSIIALALVSAASAAVVQRVDDSKSDWKYAVGWDGTTLPADAIGTPEITNSTSTAHLEVRHCSSTSRRPSR